MEDIDFNVPVDPSRVTWPRHTGNFATSGAEVLTESFDDLCSVADNRIVLTWGNDGSITITTTSNNLQNAANADADTNAEASFGNSEVVVDSNEGPIDAAVTAAGTTAAVAVEDDREVRGTSAPAAMDVESTVTDGDPVIPRVFLPVGIDSNNNVLFRDLAHTDLTESDKHFFVQELVDTHKLLDLPRSHYKPFLAGSCRRYNLSMADVKSWMPDSEGTPLIAKRFTVISVTFTVVAQLMQS
jgi:hypothetical protein